MLIFFFLLCDGTAVYTAQQLVLEEELEELIKHVSVALAAAFYITANIAGQTVYR